MSSFLEISPRPGSSVDPVAAVTACIENGKDAVLFLDGALPPEFFDLSTRVAGNVVQRLTTYGIRMAAVVPDPAAYSDSFRDFAREANRGRQFRFFADREQAAEWLGEG